MHIDSSNRPNALIIGCNKEMAQICASAARISTTKGDAYEIFFNKKAEAENDNLINKVLSSGHKSFIEHAVFTIAFKDVSAFVEQYLIEFRLASFTIKSRRYVDFSGLGYHTPDDLDADGLALYKKYMDLLFQEYNKLLDDGVPKEDARFLLPYSFNSNFYCTVNGRELAHILGDIKFGRGRNIPELRSIGAQITEQLETLFPSLIREVDLQQRLYAGEPVDDAADSAAWRPGGHIELLDDESVGFVELVQAAPNPVKSLLLSYKLKFNNGGGADEDASDIDRLVGSILKSPRPRELEQLHYTFLISGVSLSGITHLVRHRMQSIIIPPLQTVNTGRCIVPATVKHNKNFWQRYNNVIGETQDIMGQIDVNSALSKYHYYFALSGNLLDVVTTMNAREIMLFMQLRACNRAQWEVRNIAVRMLEKLRTAFPQLFNKLGPSCYLLGKCPEGNMTCGRIKETMAMFKA